MKFDHSRNRHEHHKRWGRFDLEEGFARHHRGGGPRDGFGGRGEGRRRFFERGEFKMALLELLAASPMHGYQLIKAMEEKTGGLYTPSPGSIYPNLQLLEDMQWIASTESEGKKLYHITEEGATYLQQNRSERGDRSGSRWDRHGHHRSGDGRTKRDLREFMKEWSDVILLMEQAARAAKENPSSPRSARFQKIMDQLQAELTALLDTPTNPAADSTEAPQPLMEQDPGTDTQPDDKP